MVPLSVRDDVGTTRPRRQPGQACFVDLPVGEPGPSMRLHQIAYAMRQQMEGGQAVGADALAGLAGFAPPTLHSLGARVASAMSRRLFNLVITNVPGPQQPAVRRATPGCSRPTRSCRWPRGRRCRIGLTSYDGGVYYGLNADRDAMPDLDVLGQCLMDALAELVESRERRR